MGIVKFKVGSTMRMIAAYVSIEEYCKLLLVKDDGIYLCAFPVPSPTFMLYADGCDPADEDDDQTVYDRCRDLLGDNDFVDKVPLEWLKLAIEMNMQDLYIDVSGDKLELVNANGDLNEIFSDGGTHD